MTVPSFVTALPCLSHPHVVGSNGRGWFTCTACGWWRWVRVPGVNLTGRRIISAGESLLWSPPAEVTP